MTYQLAEGVNLHVLQTKQYKTVRIFVRFTTRLKKEVITKRSLLSSLLAPKDICFFNSFEPIFLFIYFFF